jgi:hypothetical protein
MSGDTTRKRHENTGKLPAGVHVAEVSFVKPGHMQINTKPGRTLFTRVKHAASRSAM